MMEQTGEEIDWKRCPPDIEDFPPSINTALNIYNSMNNRIYPDVGYVGKDYTNFFIWLDLHSIQDYEKDWLMEIILFVESAEIEASQKAIKAAYDKIKK